MIKYNSRILSSNEIFTIFAGLIWLMSKFNVFKESSGYLTIFTIIVGACVYFKGISIKRNNLKLLAMIIFWILLIITTPMELFSSYFNISLIVLISCVLFYYISNDQASRRCGYMDGTGKKYGLADLVFFLMFIDYIGQILLYRMTQSATAFRNESQYVSFSIEVLMIYMYGMKRGHVLFSWILAIATVICIPSRTFLVFIFFHVLCYLFKDRLEKILRKGPFKTTFRIMFLFSIIFIIIGLLFVYVFPQVLTMTAGHGGITELFDSSNYSRFRSIVYALYALLKSAPFFNGIAEFDSYFTIGNIGFINMHHPHNSYLQLMVFYSICFGGIVIYMISKIFDQYMQGINICFIIPYIIIANILHDLFTTNIFLFLVILNMEEHHIKYKLLLRREA